MVSSGALGALDARARSELAAGVLRVLKPGGAFILVERGAAPHARRPCARARCGAAGWPRASSLARPGSQAARRARRPRCRARCGRSARAWVRACARPAPAPRLRCAVLRGAQRLCACRPPGAGSPARAPGLRGGDLRRRPGRPRRAHRGLCAQAARWGGTGARHHRRSARPPRRAQGLCGEQEGLSAWLPAVMRAL